MRCVSKVPSGGPAGRLLLVSVGVGDPDNITVRAQRAVADATLVLCRPGLQARYGTLLAGKAVLDAGHLLFTPLARRKYDEAEVAAREADIRQQVRAAVADGQTVVVLDSGDTALYGPSAGYLSEFRDLAPVVVPGLSSFNAANAALATVLTNGSGSQSVILTKTKNALPGYAGPDTLAALAQTRSSMVLFTMGLDLPAVVAQLRQHYPADTPVALVMHAGEAARQSVVRHTLGTVESQVDAAALPFELLIYVGDAVGN